MKNTGVWYITRLKRLFKIYGVQSVQYIARLNFLGVLWCAMLKLIFLTCHFVECHCMPHIMGPKHHLIMSIGSQQQGVALGRCDTSTFEWIIQSVKCTYFIDCSR